MSWKRLTVEDLKLVLAQDEIDKLEQCSVDVEDRIQKTMDSVADMFRNAWRAKGYSVYARDHWIDEGYAIPVLNFARWQIWTTFPLTENYSLTEPREKGYEEAVELLKNPYLATSTPDYSEDPDLSANVPVNTDSAIRLPWQRLPAEPWQEGFVEPYVKQINEGFTALGFGQG